MGEAARRKALGLAPRTADVPHSRASHDRYGAARDQWRARAAALGWQRHLAPNAPDAAPALNRRQRRKLAAR